MTKHMMGAALVACVIALISVPLTAQNSVQTAGVKTQAGAKDTNVKTDNALNSPDQKIAAPERKGGPKAKALTCNAHIDNQTPLYVRYYMNGDLEAIIGPYGDYYPAYTLGNAVLYAKAVFPDGSFLSFGPRNYSCSGSDFTWTLTP